MSLIRSLRHLLTCLLILLPPSHPTDCTNTIQEPEDLPNLLAGSFTDGQDFSTGNTLPLVGMPWGFNHWAPQTRRDSGSWWFNGNDHSFYWMRCTHQPSPWIGDYAWFVFSPMLGHASGSSEQYWEPRGATIKPHLFDATIAPHGIRFELAPTMHGAILRATFPKSSDERFVCFKDAEWNSRSGGKLKGVTTRVTSDRLPVRNFKFHIVVSSDSDTRFSDAGGAVCFTYGNEQQTVVLRISTSLISEEMAQLSLDRELPLSNSFDDIAALSRREWNGLLKRVDVVDAGPMSEDASRHLSVFYTGLYRALTFPRRTDETDSSGKTVHYSPFDPSGRVHEGPGVTDNGFWDTFRTVYPLLSLLYPDKLGPIIQGWLNAFTEGGWLPSWASPGYRNCMVGTFADVVIADAIVKNVKGFDLFTAYEALKKDSFSSPPVMASGAVGKHGLDEYKSKSYISSNGGTGGDYVSRTLDFAFADWASARAFLHLSEDSSFSQQKAELIASAKDLHDRSARAVKALYSSTQGLMVPKDSSGHFSNSFNDIEWGNGYTEGNSWHHSFPPFAIEELIALHGSRVHLLKKLKHLVSMASNFRPGSYGSEIHEMKEGRAVAMGQYGHNNQPSHHLLYLFTMLGDKETTETAVRKIMDRAYGRDFFAGDEDNGEQGSWYVLSALGLFSIAPGSPDYVIGSPMFRHVIIKRYDKIGAEIDPLHIVAKDASRDNIHVSKVYLNGEMKTGPTISDIDIQKGGVLQFVLGKSSEDALMKLSAEQNAVFRLDVVEEEWKNKYERSKEKEDMLEHQVEYLKQKMSLKGNETSSDSYYKLDSEEYFVFSFLLVLIGIAGCTISIQHLRSISGKGGGGRFDKSGSIYSV